MATHVTPPDPPKGKRYLRLSLTQVRALGRYLERRNELAHQTLAELQDIVEQIQASGMFQHSPDDPWEHAQDYLAATIYNHLVEVITHWGTVQKIVMDAKRECGVQLDANEVKKSVRQLFSDIKQSLDDQ